MGPSVDLAARLEGVDRVLVLAPSHSGGAATRACNSLMGEDTPVYVSLVRTADDVVEAARETLDPAQLGAVVVDDTRAGQSLSANRYPPGIRVEVISSPGDLTGIGIAVTQCLQSFDNSNASVCFDSLTVLLQYVDPEQAFRFLHVLSRYTDTGGTRFHAHLDPATQDERTLATLAPLFDAVVRYDDGEWQIRKQ